MVTLTLELNEHQTDIVIKALELYARIGTGRLDAIMNHPALAQMETDTEKTLLELKQTAFPQLQRAGDALAMRSEDVGVESKNAYDIMQTMEHQRALSKGNRNSVWHFAPIPAGNQALPTCRLAQSKN